MTRQTEVYVDLAYLYEIADGNDEFALELITDYLNAMPGDVATLADAVQQKNQVDVRFTTHKLKGAFRFIGCNGIADIIENIDYLSDQGNDKAALDNMIEVQQLYPKAIAALKLKQQELIEKQSS